VGTRGNRRGHRARESGPPLRGCYPERGKPRPGQASHPRPASRLSSEALEGEGIKWGVRSSGKGQCGHVTAILCTRLCPGLALPVIGLSLGPLGPLRSLKGRKAQWWHTTSRVQGCAERTFLRSEVSWGMERRMTEPSLEGVRPMSDFIMAFSIDWMLHSQKNSQRTCINLGEKQKRVVHRHAETVQE